VTGHAKIRPKAWPKAWPKTWLAVRSVIGLVLSAYTVMAGDPVRAEGRLDARYTVSLAGIAIGKGAWVIDISENQFTAAASGNTVGLLRVLASGGGTSASRGAMVGGKPVAASFAASITADKKSEEIRMTLGSGDVKDLAITPSPTLDPNVLPITEAHLRGVNDPMTGSLVRVPGTGPTIGPQACQRPIPVFDGRIRYTLTFAYKRMEQVKLDKGYQGPVAVCAVTFTPVAGYNPARSGIKYLTEQRDMEVWLAPIAGTRLLVPFRMSIPTPLGKGVMEATQFISLAQPPRAAAPKTQSSQGAPAATYPQIDPSSQTAKP
jgi:hypothetical protein